MSDLNTSSGAYSTEEHTVNNHWLHRSLNAVWHPCTQMQHHPQLPLIPIQRAQGAWLYDFDGHRILDAISSWWVNVLGHAHPHITASIHKQVDTLCHVMLAGFTHQPVIELSERLIALAPKGLGHCFYASDGASATEIALKMSLHSWQQNGFPNKQHFAYLEHSYHGETAGALSVTDVPLFRQHYHPLLSAHYCLASPDPRPLNASSATIDPESDLAESAASQALKQAETLLDRTHQELAAVIIEPLVQGAAGMLMYHSSYLKGLRQLCDHYQIHLIADEIMTGFGRTGTLFACEQSAIQPDFLCLSKGITGGTLPLSVVMTTEAVYTTFFRPEFHKGFLHSHSYTGNPIACAAACAVLDVFEKESIIQRNQNLAQKITSRTQHFHHHAVQHLRQRGMILAFDIANPPHGWSKHAFETALRHNVLLRPIGKTLYIMPPYCLDDTELDLVFNALEYILNTL